MTRRFFHEVHRVYSTQRNRYSKGLSDNPAVYVAKSVYECSCRIDDVQSTCGEAQLAAEGRRRFKKVPPMPKQAVATNPT